MHAPLTDTQEPFFAWGPRIGHGLVGFARLPSPESRDAGGCLRGRRQIEYTAGRSLAAQLLARLGAADTAVAAATDGCPRWPRGFVGSISHSDHLVGVAVAHDNLLRGVGIDIEAVMDGGVADEVGPVCLGPSERSLGSRTRMGQSFFTTLCFSAKEALYKCLYPLVGHVFDFGDVEVIAIDERAGALQISLLRDFGRDFPRGSRLQGFYGDDLGHIFTAFALPSPSTTGKAEKDIENG